MKYLVTIERTVDQYSQVVIEADGQDAAEEKVNQRLADSNAPPLDWKTYGEVRPALAELAEETDPFTPVSLDFN